jgi:hypothetical protein
MDIEINNNIIIIEKQIYKHGPCKAGVNTNCHIVLESSNGILSIVITNLPLHVSRYFTKIRLNYNPINKKIHLRCNNADQDIAYRFGIVDNNKEFDNVNDVITYLQFLYNPYSKTLIDNYHSKKYKHNYSKYIIEMFTSPYLWISLLVLITIFYISSKFIIYPPSL